MLSGKRVVRNVHKCHVTHDCKSGAYSHCRKSLAIPPFHFCNCCWVGFFSMTKIKVLYVFGQWAVSSNQYTVHSMLSGKRVVRNVHKCHVTHDCKSEANSHCRKSLAIPPFHFCNCCWVAFFSMTKINLLYIFRQWAVHIRCTPCSVQWQAASRNVHKCHVTRDYKSEANSRCIKSLAIPPFHFCKCCWVAFFSMTKIKVLYVFGQWAVSSNQYTMRSTLSGKRVVRNVHKCHVTHGCKSKSK